MDRAHYAALVGLVSAALAGCAPKIGSKCVLNTDCGTSGALVCDTSQLNGYCTQFNCTPNSCRNQAVCVEFLPMVPGCTYDDYRSPSRSSRDFCMEHCTHDSDCRQSDGYVCKDPRQPPWNAAITDDNQSQMVCILPPPADTPSPVGVSLVNGSLPPGSVCSPNGPFVPPLDAGVEVADGASEGAADGGERGEGGSFEGGPDTGPDAGEDAGVDAGQDGVFDDGGTEEGAGDTAGADSPSDGAADAGGPDAPGGG